MPYTSCPSCHLTVYSSTRYSRIDDCPRCHSSLRPPVNIAAIRQMQRTFAQRDSLITRPRPTSN
jgi:Zn-finger nucleic acid-binding protein